MKTREPTGRDVEGPFWIMATLKEWTLFNTTLKPTSIGFCELPAISKYGALGTEE